MSVVIQLVIKSLTTFQLAGVVSREMCREPDKRALQLWGRAAKQMSSNAHIKLGDYHYYGRGTPVDYEAAASHYKFVDENKFKNS